MDFTRVNIAVKPSQEIVEKAIKLSQEVSKKDYSYYVKRMLGVPKR